MENPQAPESLFACDSYQHLQQGKTTFLKVSLPRILLVQKQKYLITIVCLCALVDLPMTVLVKISWMVQRENFAKKQRRKSSINVFQLMFALYLQRQTVSFDVHLKYDNSCVNKFILRSCITYRLDTCYLLLKVHCTMQVQATDLNSTVVSSWALHNEQYHFIRNTSCEILSSI